MLLLAITVIQPVHRSRERESFVVLLWGDQHTSEPVNNLYRCYFIITVIIIIIITKKSTLSTKKNVVQGVEVKRNIIWEIKCEKGGKYQFFDSWKLKAGTFFFLSKYNLLFVCNCVSKNSFEVKLTNKNYCIIIVLYVIKFVSPNSHTQTSFSHQIQHKKLHKI